MKGNTLAKPFDTSSPRFDYRKQEERLMKSPGPGHYTKHYDEIEERKQAEIRRAGTINKKYVPAIGHENKEKFSLFGQIVKTGVESQLGPGTYETLNTVTSRKGFNVTLQKPFNSNVSIGAGGILGTSGLSTTLQLSPRSNSNI